MKPTFLPPVSLCVALLVGPGAALCSAAPAAAARNRAVASVMETRFIANTGQLEDEQVSFYARTFRGTVSVLADGSISYAVPPPPAEHGRSVTLFKETFAHGQDHGPRGLTPLASSLSIFKGNDPSRWRPRVPTFRAVSLTGSDAAINVALVARGQNIEKYFRVQPGADPGHIAVRVHGAEQMYLTAEGDLVATGRGTDLRFTAPKAYQATGRVRDPIKVAYRVQGDTYGFDVGAYDPTRELVIDPLLASTYVGGSNNLDVALDAVAATNGNLYVAMFTLSTDVPVTSNAVTTNAVGGSDTVIALFNNDLDQLLASTYLGGDGNEDVTAVTLDTNGCVVVVGSTDSTNYPTWGAYQAANAGGQDAFVTKLDPWLTNLLASTYVGGSNDDDAVAVQVSPQNDVYFTGPTASPDFPVDQGAYDPTFNPTNSGTDCYVAKLSPDLNSLLASTFLGGTSGDTPKDLTLDADNTLYVCGYTASSDFPVSAGAYASSYAGGTYDGFVSRLNPGLTALQASSFLGGSLADQAWVVCQGKTELYVAGATASGDFPTTPGAYDTNGVASTDHAFVCKLAPALTNVNASTLLGTSVGWVDMTLDDQDRVFLAGATRSPTFPTTLEGRDTSYNGGFNDAFVSKLNAPLSQLLASTFHGGTETDLGRAVELGPSNEVFVVGDTYSPDFPTARGYDPTYNSNGDAFVSKFDPDLSHWWRSYGVIDTGAALPNDYGAVNQGQLKWIAQKAFDAMNALLTDGADSGVSNMVDRFSATNNYRAVTIGQAKTTAQPFYDRLGLTNYPWLGAPATNDYGAANIGQIKNLFSFPIHE